MGAAVIGRKAGKSATLITFTGLLSNTLALAMRASVSGNLPFTNSYEFLLLFSWTIVLLYLIFEYRTKLRLAGLFVLPVAWGLLGYVAVLMPEQQKSVVPLMPALKSNWLTIHVATAAGSYGAFALACGLAILFLWGKKFFKNAGTKR